MSVTFYKLNKPRPRKKMAAFDYDWTLVIPKDGRRFSKDVDDWKWYFENVPDTLKWLYKEGYMICIFTNQSKKWKDEQIVSALSTLNIPMYVSIAKHRDVYKPKLDIYKAIVKKNISKKDSFYVGDALGRKTDFSDSDKVFAENIGVKCFSPENYFLSQMSHDKGKNKGKNKGKEGKKEKNARVMIPKVAHSEIIVMVGFPGSGKTTVVNSICKDPNYVHIPGDVYKTSKKMIRAAKDHVKKGKSIIFDATNPAKKKRKEYIDFAKKHNYKVRCIHLKTSLETSYQRNRLRDSDKQVPRIAYSVFKKYFEIPDETEGFEILSIE